MNRKNLRHIWLYISPKHRIYLALLFVLMAIASLAEVVSIGAIVPFLGVLTAPERVYEQPIIQPIIKFFNLSDPKQLLLPLTIGFIVATLFAGIMRLSLAWLQIRLSFSMGADFGIAIYERTLYQPYSTHISRNSSELIAGITAKGDSLIYGLVQPWLTLSSSLIALAAILAILIFINPIVAFSAFLGFSLIYLTIFSITRSRVAIDSDEVSKQTTNVIKALQEGLGGIRDVIIDSTQSIYISIFQNAFIPLQRAIANIQIVGSSPRFIVEALGMVLIAVIAFFLASSSQGVQGAIPILGALALGAQRLLPLLQQTYAAANNLRGYRLSVQDALALLDQPLPECTDMATINQLPFKNVIEINNLGFQFALSAPWVFRNLNLSIPKGRRIGLIGTTGSGKSTLLDVIMGLLTPTEGMVLIDGKKIESSNKRHWQARIAHVPQFIYLSDASIAENIAFGLPMSEINYLAVKKAAERAQISEAIEAWPESYQTKVGERGIRLSGGQRQRIGIARALYKQADVIILDEATSALDSETESKIMQAFDKLDRGLTLIIVAHRLTTLKGCDSIVEVSNGALRNIGTYEQLLKKNIQNMMENFEK